MTDDAIADACRRFGAANVYRAAVAAFTGPSPALVAMGLHSRGVADANRIMTAAYKLLSPEDQAADLADVTIALAKLRG